MTIARAADELRRLRLAVATPQVLGLMSERLFSPEEREALGGELDNLGAVAAWQRVRDVTTQRAVLDIARGVSLVDDATYRWLVRQIGEQGDDEGDAGQPVGGARPHWNRATGILSFQGQFCREVELRRSPTRLQLILDAFEEDGWPPRIDSPLRSSNPSDLHDAVRQLKIGLKHLLFSAQEGGKAVSWRRKESQ